MLQILLIILGIWPSFANNGLPMLSLGTQALPAEKFSECEFIAQDKSSSQYKNFTYQGYNGSAHIYKSQLPGGSVAIIKHNASMPFQYDDGNSCPIKALVFEVYNSHSSTVVDNDDLGINLEGARNEIDLFVRFVQKTGGTIDDRSWSIRCFSGF